MKCGLIAQVDPEIDAILRLNRTQINQIQAANSASSTLLPSTFAQNNVTLQRSVDQLRELTILKVYYVYTNYKQSPTFNQRALDQKRLEQLQNTFPELVADPTIEWQLIEQTGCTSPEMGTMFFHGFIIIHRPNLSETERLAEIKRLETYLQNPSDVFVQPQLDPLISQLNPPKNQSNSISLTDQKAQYTAGSDAMLSYLKSTLRTDEIALKRDDKWVKTSFTVEQNGEITNIEIEGSQPERIEIAINESLTEMPKWTPATRDSLPVASTIQLEVRISYSPSVNGMYLMNGERPTLETNPLMETPDNLASSTDGITSEQIFLKSSAVYKGLEVLNPDEKSALVMDVTGSMTDNVAALKRWITAHQDSLQFTSFTFFNDGDGKETRKKKMGETGGIYQTFNPLAINDLITQTMEKGSGGERPENDVEAILFAEKNDSLCDVILLVADNYSEVRDLELVRNVNKKVNVLICAGFGAVRVDYLLLAKETGGDLIFNGERIQLSGLQNREVLSVGSYQYDYIGGMFTLRKTTESTTRTKLDD